MGDLTQLDVIRRRGKKRRIIKKIIMLILVVAIILGGLWAFSSIHQMGFQDWIDQMVSSFSTGKGYPVDLPGSGFVQMSNLNDNFALLSDTNIYLYNGNGKQLQNIQHKYFNPVLKTERSRALTYDVGGKTLAVHSLAKSLFEKEFDNTILTADISTGGELAVALTSQEYLSQVVVYNAAFKEKYQWSSISNYVSALAVSGNNLLAIGGVNAEEGSLISNLLIFQMDSKDEKAKVTFDNEMILSIDFDESSNIRVLTELGVYLYTPAGQLLGEYDFGGEPVVLFDQSSPSDLAVVVGDYTHDRFVTLISLDKNLKVKGTVQVSERPDSLKVYNQRVFLLNGERVTYYTSDLTASETCETYDAQMMEPAGGYLYYLTGQQICRERIK